MQKQQQQQQTQAEQPSAAEAPAGQEGLLQGPHCPQGLQRPQERALHGADGPQAEQQAEQSAAAAAAEEQGASAERPGAAAGGGRASLAAEPAKAEAPPKLATAATEQAAAGSAQAAASGSARASVLLWQTSPAAMAVQSFSEVHSGFGFGCRRSLAEGSSYENAWCTQAFLVFCGSNGQE